ncbi:MAG: DciA family protein [Nocardioidaceae bacterium]
MDDPEPAPPSGGPDGPERPDDVVPADGPTDVPDHDPTGLDLARSVAAQLKGAPGRKPVRPTRRQHPSGPTEFSGAHPDDRDPAPLGAAVERLVTDSGWTTDVSVHTVLGRWAQLVGPEVAPHCTPVSYVDGVVAVTADSTAWATQLTLLAATIVARLNGELGDGTVIRIQVSGPAGPTWRRGRRSVRDGRGPRDTYG